MAGNSDETDSDETDSDETDSDETDSEALGPAERQAWYAFLGWSRAILANVAAELTLSAGLSMPDIEVLIRLGEAPASGLGQRELVGSLNWSASRASHHLSRMGDRGLITRRPAGPGRLVNVSLTSPGWAEYHRMQHLLAHAVRRHFLDHLTDRHRAELLAARPSGVGPDGQASSYSQYVLSHP